MSDKKTVTEIRENLSAIDSIVRNIDVIPVTKGGTVVWYILSIDKFEAMNQVINDLRDIKNALMTVEALEPFSKYERMNEAIEAYKNDY